VKVTLGGDEMLFSHFLQVKFLYEAMKDKDNISAVKPNKQSLEVIKKA
jgi:hypothetical protein